MNHKDNELQAPSSRRMSYALWTVQVLLALLFVFSGVMKLVTPVEKMQGPIALPGSFLHFIGVAEIAGGLGLILPGMFRIKPALIWLAAAGLTIIMIGATIMTVAGGTIGLAMIPLAVTMLAGFVAWGRLRHPIASRRL